MFSNEDAELSPDERHYAGLNAALRSVKNGFKNRNQLLTSVEFAQCSIKQNTRRAAMYQFRIFV